MHGVCTQRHFPAVAQPFRVLWAPWSLAAAGFALAFFLSMLVFGIFGATVGGILFPVFILVGHGSAIVLGMKLRYFATLLLSIEARKTGSSNLADNDSSFDFANI